MGLLTVKIFSFIVVCFIWFSYILLLDVHQPVAILDKDNIKSFLNIATVSLFVYIVRKVPVEGCLVKRFITALFDLCCISSHLHFYLRQVISLKYLVENDKLTVYLQSSCKFQQ